MKHKRFNFLYFEVTHLCNNYIPNFRCFIYNSINFKSALRDEMAKRLFHLFENQHLNFLDVGFFLPVKTEFNL